MNKDFVDLFESVDKKLRTTLDDEVDVRVHGLYSLEGDCRRDSGFFWYSLF
jgi:hypothetical protein